MVRATFFLLVLANLAYLAWAQWIDVPRPAPANDVYAKLPRLKLVGEQPSTAPEKPSSSENGSARKTSLQSAAPLPADSRCFSIGPFDDTAGAARGASLLRARGLAPRQRTAQDEISKGFWVYIGGLKTDRDVTDVLRTLEQSHVEDAHLMPDPDPATTDHRISVGLFSDHDRADRRAQSLHKLGLQPEVAERKLPTTVFWVDVDVPSGTAAPTPHDLAAADSASPHLDVSSCPPSARPDGGATPLPSPPGVTTTFRTKVAGASRVP